MLIFIGQAPPINAVLSPYCKLINRTPDNHRTYIE
jgi:hypothetical protein